MSEINLKPIKNLVLVEVENDVKYTKRLRSKEELAEMKFDKVETTSGLLLTSEEDAFETVEELTPSNRCKIVRIGSTVTEVKEGDYCMFNTNGGHELTYAGNKFKLIKEDDILLIIEP